MMVFSNTVRPCGISARIEQRHVRSIGEHALMDGRLVGQLAGCADPDVEAAAFDLLAEIAVEFDRPQFDRALALVIAAHRVGHHWQHPLLDLALGRQLLGRRHVRHLA